MQVRTHGLTILWEMCDTSEFYRGAPQLFLIYNIDK